ncbi:WD repeat-containing protein 24, partial [Chytriomyces hyalinus]
MDASISFALMPTGISTGTDTFSANATAPEVYPTTGFVTRYIWSSLDNATWCAFLMYQLYYSFVILNEAALNHKQTFIWALVFFAIACNMMASISGFFLLDCTMFNLTPDPHICDGQMHVYYALEGMCYCLGFWLLFYRKYKVVPEKIGYTGAVDVVVLVACCSLNLAKNVRCFYSDINTCFLQDVFQASAGALSFLYFDLWFLVCVMRKTFEGGSKWEVLQLCALTGSMTFLYLVGSISYKTWGGNFYTNILWNIVDSVVSPKFLKLFAKEKTSVAKRTSQTTTNDDPSTASGKKPRPASVVGLPSVQPGSAGATLVKYGKQLDSVVGTESMVERAILKVLTVRETDIKDQVNLRAGIKSSLNFSLTDVKWANAFAPQMIASAYLNGDIAVWDLNKGANKIGSEPILLLSACQDATIKMWDLRQKSETASTFEGRADKVRDVQFSPTSSYEFIAAFENGDVQKWDIRKPNEPERRWSAHYGLALTVDWHPDGKVFASAGRDRVIKVWDTESTQRKPIYSIQTISHVARIAWRPQRDSNETAFQIASCSLAADSKVSVWDLGRPFVAEWAVEEHDAPITDFLWHDSRVLWTVSKDHTFVRQDLEVAGYHPAKNLSPCAVSWNPFGDLTFSAPKVAAENNVQEAHADSNSIPKNRRRSRSPFPIEESTRSTSETKVNQPFSFPSYTNSPAAGGNRVKSTEGDSETPATNSHLTNASSLPIIATEPAGSDSPVQASHQNRSRRGETVSSPASNVNRGKSGNSKVGSVGPLRPATGGASVPSIVSTHPGPPDQIMGVSEPEFFNHAAFITLSMNYDSGNSFETQIGPDGINQRRGTHEQLLFGVEQEAVAQGLVTFKRGASHHFKESRPGGLIDRRQEIGLPHVNFEMGTPGRASLPSKMRANSIFAGTGGVPSSSSVTASVAAGHTSRESLVGSLHLSSRLRNGPTGLEMKNMRGASARVDGGDNSYDSYDSDYSDDEDDYRINHEVLKATLVGGGGPLAIDAGYRSVAGKLLQSVSGWLRRTGGVGNFGIHDLQFGNAEYDDVGEVPEFVFGGAISDGMDSLDSDDNASGVDGRSTGFQLEGMEGMMGPNASGTSSAGSFPPWNTRSGFNRQRSDFADDTTTQAADDANLVTRTFDACEPILVPQLDRDELVHDLLRFYGELGNAQMCSTIAL